MLALFASFRRIEVEQTEGKKERSKVMELRDVIKDRYSCRGFTTEQITEEELSSILEAGRLAPSAINRQPWRFLVLEGDDLDRVDECTRCRYGAQTAILVCFDREESAKNPDVTPDYGWIDCGLALMQMALQAEDLGLGSCIVGAYDPAVATEVFAIPDNIVTYQFLMLGHKDADPAPRHFERRPLEEVVLRGAYD